MNKIQSLTPKHLLPNGKMELRHLGSSMVNAVTVLWMEEEMATPSSIPAWRIPWTKESGRLQSTGSQRIGHD